MKEDFEIMSSFQKWKCSWSLVAAIASIFALASIVHLFLFPLVPSFSYISSREAQDSCVPTNGSIQSEIRPPPLDLGNRFPADLHRAVLYRSAPWKAEIGRWLSGCHAIAKEVNIVEVITVKALCLLILISATFFFIVCRYCFP